MLADYVWPDRQDRADELTPTAEELVERIRTDDPTALCLELLGRFDWWQMAAVICLLAAQVDPHAAHEVRVGWVRHADVLARAEPIRWAEDELRIEDMTTAEINDLMWRLREEKHMQYQDIADRVQLDPAAVSKRLERMRKARAEAEEEGGAARVAAGVGR